MYDLSVPHFSTQYSTIAICCIMYVLHPFIRNIYQHNVYHFNTILWHCRSTCSSELRSNSIFNIVIQSTTLVVYTFVELHSNTILNTALQLYDVGVTQVYVLTQYLTLKYSCPSISYSFIRIIFQHIIFFLLISVKFDILCLLWKQWLYITYNLLKWRTPDWFCNPASRHHTVSAKENNMQGIYIENIMFFSSSILII